MGYSLGARRSPAEHLAKTQDAATHPDVAPHLNALTGAAPTPATPAQQAAHPVNFLCPREDQGQSGSCTCGSLSQGFWSSCSARGVAPPSVPSPHHWYSCSGALEDATANPLGPLPLVIPDNGRQLSDVMTAAMTFGMKGIQAPTPDGRFYDIWTANDTDAKPANVGDQPDGIALEQSASDCLSAAHTVTLSASNAVAVCRTAVDAGITLWVAFLCGNDFQNLGPNDIAQPTPTTDTTAGGHAVCVVDYRINAAGEYEWLVLNQWGSSWALSGMVWASTAWLLAAWEVWLLDNALLSAAKKAA